MNSLNRYAGTVYCIMRLVVGLLFACHGGQKILGFPPGGHGAGEGIMLIGACIELVAGFMIALGLLTRVAAFPNCSRTSDSVERRACSDSMAATRLRLFLIRWFISRIRSSFSLNAASIAFMARLNSTARATVFPNPVRKLMSSAEKVHVDVLSTSSTPKLPRSVRSGTLRLDTTVFFENSRMAMHFFRIVV